MSQLRIGTEDVRRYLAAVEVELSDLDADDRAELLADVEEHLTEVATEHHGALEDRLGDPAAYVSELRTSAGLPARTTAPRRPALGAWRSLATRVLADGRVRWLRYRLAEVGPGWWVLRGYLFVLGFAVATNSMSRTDVPFPRLAGNQFFGAVVVGVMVWASVALGRLAARRRAARIASIILTALVVVMALGGLDELRAAPTPYRQTGPPPTGVRHWDGTEALDLCPYAADGKPLSGVLIFDQAGRPITEVPRVPGSSGQDVMNAYPRGIRVPSADGVLRDAPCPKLAAVQVSTPDGPSWIEAVVGGAPVYRALLGEGETRTFYGEQIFLVVGNAGAVELKANGKAVGKPGAIGEIYRGVFDPSTKTLPPLRFAP